MMKYEFFADDGKILEIFEKKQKCAANQIGAVAMCIILLIIDSYIFASFGDKILHFGFSRRSLYVLILFISTLLCGIAAILRTKQKKVYARLLRNLNESRLVITDTTVSGTSFDSEMASPKYFSVPLHDLLTVSEAPLPLSLTLQTKAESFHCLYLKGSHKAYLILEELLQMKLYS